MWPRGLHLQASLSPAHCTASGGMKTGQATSWLLFHFPASAARSPPSVCWVLCLLHIGIAGNFVFLLPFARWLGSNPSFTQLLTHLGQPLPRFLKVCHAYSGQPQPRFLSLKIVVNVLIITLIICLLWRSQRAHGKETSFPVQLVQLRLLYFSSAGTAWQL